MSNNVQCVCSIKMIKGKCTQVINGSVYMNVFFWIHFQKQTYTDPWNHSYNLDSFLVNLHPFLICLLDQWKKVLSLLWLEILPFIFPIEQLRL